MGKIYFLIFWIPAAASGSMLLLTRQTGILDRPGWAAAWFGLALLMQVVSRSFSSLWVIGLVLQAILGVYLAIRIKIG